MSYNDIFKLLSNCMIQNKVFFVHDFATKKDHVVDINNVIRFFRDYIEALYRKDNRSPVFMLGEATGEIIPVISEFKFKFEVNNKELYDKKIIHKLIDCHHKVFKELIHLSPNSTEYTCVAMTGANYEENGLFCTKIKLLFPYCKVSKVNLNTIFRQRILSRIRKAKLESYFTSSVPLGSWDQHFLPLMDFYPFYGSTENKIEPPTLFENIYGEYISSQEECKPIALENAFDYHDYQYIKNGQCLYEEVETLVDEEEGKTQKGNYEASFRLLTIFCSVNFSTSVSRIKEGNLNATETSSSADASEKHSRDSDTDPSDTEICIEMIELLDQFRFEEENFFLDIGKALYNACRGEESGLNIWFRAGEDRGCKYTLDFCRNHYDKFDEFHITVKTLAWYARKDNPEQYQRWHNEWCLPKLQRCYREQDDIIIAEAFYRVFWLEYFFNNKTWYKYDKSRLKKFKDEVYLRNDITERFIPKFIHLRTQICEEQLNVKAHAASSSRLERENKDLEAHLAAITKIIKKLHSDRNRNTLVKCVRDLFFKEDIGKILDTNPDLLGVKNGVIETLEDKAIFREGKPEDYITKKTGVSYRSEYSYEHPDLKKLMLYFRQVFPNQSINHHMKKDVASMLYGRNSEKVFRMWIGDTNGSKSIFQSILKHMFGEYYCDIPAEFFSASQKNSSGPNPEAAQLKGSRVAFASEPDEDAEFKGARMKKMSGNDSFFARGCGEDGGSIDATFKIFMVLNRVPNINGMDYATLKRICMVLFECQWLKPGEAKAMGLPDDIEEQINLKTFIQDDRIEKDIPRLASALLWLAVEYYKVYREEGLETPAYISDWMTNYWTKHDPYNAFIVDCIENVKIRVVCEDCCEEDEEDKKLCKNCENGFVEKIDYKKFITATDIFSTFKAWLKETYPSMKMINKTKMVDILSAKDKLGKQRENKWFGYKLKEHEVNMIGE